MFGSNQALATTISVDGVSYNVQFTTGESFTDNEALLQGQTWWEDADRAKAFRDAYYAANTVDNVPFFVWDSSAEENTDRLFFAYEALGPVPGGGVRSADIQDVYSGVTGTDAVAQSATDSSGVAIHYAYVSAASAPTATFSPVNGATNVAADGTITITFDEAVRLTNDTALTNDNVDALITLKDTDGSGANILFDASVSGNVITITPTSNFSSSQRVYVAIGATVEDDADNAITATNATFTVADTLQPTLVISGPSELVIEPFTLTFTFSEDVIGFDGDDITISGGNLGGFSGSGGVYTVIVTPVMGELVSVFVAENVAQDAAGNLNEASIVYTIQAGSPASEFEKYTDEIRQVIVDDAERSLQSVLATNRRMVQGARTRFIASQEQQAACSENEEAASTDEACVDVASRNNVAFDVDGSAQASGTTLSTSGTFFGQQGNFDGTSRRLVFGDFDVQHDGDTGSSTATIAGRVAWERMTSDTTMLGYFIGGELAHSSTAGAFDGDQDRLGLTVGGYAVHQLSEELYADGYFSLGAGRNNLDMANDVLALTSDYTTQTATIGGSLSGVYEYGLFDLRPELAFSYGKTWIGKVDFTGRAYGLVDDTLSLDAGNVTIANLTLRPEVIWALDGTTVADSNSQFSFAPRLICEQVRTTGRTEDCGGGAEIGLSSTSDDGLSNAEFRVIIDRVGDTTRSSLVFNLERQF
jgi:hypothetical protein